MRPVSEDGKMLVRGCYLIQSAPVGRLTMWHDIEHIDPTVAVAVNLKYVATFAVVGGGSTCNMLSTFAVF